MEIGVSKWGSFQKGKSVRHLAKTTRLMLEATIKDVMNEFWQDAHDWDEYVGRCMEEWETREGGMGKMMQLCGSFGEGYTDFVYDVEDLGKRQRVIYAMAFEASSTEMRMQRACDEFRVLVESARRHVIGRAWMDVKAMRRVGLGDVDLRAHKLLGCGEQACELQE